jgi:preprotein translocase subunit SecE
VVIKVESKDFKRKNLIIRIWQYWLESLQELRKVYWPTRQETVHTTLAVLAMVVVMGLLLWTADYFLLHAVAWLHA